MWCVVCHPTRRLEHEAKENTKDLWITTKIMALMLWKNMFVMWIQIYTRKGGCFCWERLQILKVIRNLPNKQKFIIINHEGLLLLEKVANFKSYKEPIKFLKNTPTNHDLLKSPTWSKCLFWPKVVSILISGFKHEKYMCYFLVTYLIKVTFFIRCELVI